MDKKLIVRILLSNIVLLAGFILLFDKTVYGYSRAFLTTGVIAFINLVLIYFANISLLDIFANASHSARAGYKSTGSGFKRYNESISTSMLDKYKVKVVRRTRILTYLVVFLIFVILSQLI